MDALIEERTGARPGTVGGFFTLNPRVDDLPERFSVQHRGVRLLEMGAVEQGGSGCICPESAMLRTLFTHLLFRQDDVLILDLYAGVEHLGRATADFVDAMLVVVEPTRRSLGTAAQIARLARDIGLQRLWLVGNKVRDAAEATFIAGEAGDMPLLGCLPADLAVQEADRLGIPVYDHVPRCARQPSRWPVPWRTRWRRRAGQKRTRGEREKAYDDDHCPGWQGRCGQDDDRRPDYQVPDPEPVGSGAGD